MKTYDQLRSHFLQTSYLNKTIALLDWDHETYLPSKGVAFRADQQAFLSGLSHERLISQQVGDWIESCESESGSLDPFQNANVSAWRRDRDRAVKLPTEFVESFEKECALAKAAWAEARRKSSFEVFSNHLSKLVEMSRQKADYYGYQKNPYDALLDVYEPGCTSEDLSPVFSKLKEFIVKLLPEAMDVTRRISSDYLQGFYPLEGQKKFNEMVARAMGFDFEAGRIDATTHPFCTDLGPHDVRLTTRYNELDFTESFYSVLHEVGHGLYEQGFLPEHAGTPMSEAVSLGIHESQSRLWENKIGRDPAFWQDWYEKACECLPALKKWTPEDLTLAVNRVSPSFIRVEADEVTYDLHIILRFEMEKDLLSGDLKVEDVPAAWNERFRSMFGLEVPDDARGCLQDIHWSMGGFGYFPTYTLGNLNSAQLFSAAQSDLGTPAAVLQDGHYAEILAWLREKVHRHGRRYEPAELMQSATGQTTQPGYHARYLEHRFEVLKA